MELALQGVMLPESGTKNISVVDGKIAAITDGNTSGANGIHLEGCIAFPGLINSHDHLDFNLFPRLGNRTYRNYMEWGPDIHGQDEALIRSVLNIPTVLRTQWGIYKNLLAGVTTVVQHGEYLPVKDRLIDVFTACTSLHSVRLEQGWRWKLNKPFAARQPFAMHIGEGTDTAAYDEINELIRWNLMKRRIVGIHGVAMNAAQAAHFAALVWCPESNFFLLGKTAAIKDLKMATKILLGTDATVSADWNIRNHLRTARATGMLDDGMLMSAVTDTAAAVWGMQGKGAIKAGYDADIIVAKKKREHADNTESFFALNPEDLLLVMSRGSVVLFDESLAAQLSGLAVKDYCRIRIGGAGKFVRGNIAGLVKQIKQLYPDAAFPMEAE